MSNNVPNTVFNDWYKKTQKKAVLVEVVGIPSSAEEEPCQTTLKDPLKTSPVTGGSIMVTIKTRDGLCIQKKGLDYQDLRTLIEKLDGL